MDAQGLRSILASHKSWLSNTGGSRANLSGADLSGADLSGANLSGANLSGADLSWANLRQADLSGANLSWANLSGANLRQANLRQADLSGANLSWANLRQADLSGAEGLLEPFCWLRDTFETTDRGITVYRAQSGQFANPYGWVFEPGSELTEVCHPDRTLDCACGVAFATLEWVRKNHPSDTVWRCLIPWPRSCGVVVPYNTDGKARCDYLELIEVVEA